MTISKKLTALFAGVLLAGSFGLAGCDSSDSGSGSSGAGGSSNGSTSTNSNTSEPNSNGSSVTGLTETFHGVEYPSNPEGCTTDKSYDCFPDTNIGYPSQNNKIAIDVHSITADEHAEYEPLFDAFCAVDVHGHLGFGEGLLICEAQNNQDNYKIFYKIE